MVNLQKYNELLLCRESNMKNMEELTPWHMVNWDSTPSLLTTLTEEAGEYVSIHFEDEEWVHFIIVILSSAKGRNEFQKLCNLNMIFFAVDFIDRDVRSLEELGE